jgi:hypothetical protein
MLRTGREAARRALCLVDNSIYYVLEYAYTHTLCICREPSNPVRGFGNLRYAVVTLENECILRVRPNWQSRKLGQLPVHSFTNISTEVELHVASCSWKQRPMLGARKSARFSTDAWLLLLWYF